MKYQVISPTKQEFEGWKKLYEQYAAFYNIKISSAKLGIIWRWIHDPEIDFFCRIAISNNQVLGFVHFRPFFHPLRATTSLFLDDLLVDEKFRNKGIATQLVEAVFQFAQKKNYAIVRWLTGFDNKAAQNLYDRLAKKTSWLVYDYEV